jgi:hypothetical protein
MMKLQAINIHKVCGTFHYVGVNGEYVNWDQKAHEGELCSSLFMKRMAKTVTRASLGLVLNIYSDQSSMDKL